MAVQCGIAAEQLTDLRDWRESGLFTDEQREVLALSDELTDDVDVSDETWAALAARYEPGELVELVLTAAYYACVSRTLARCASPSTPTTPCSPRSNRQRVWSRLATQDVRRPAREMRSNVWALPVLGEVASPPAVLIRPDGYVAWTGDLTDASLPRALATWFGAPTPA